MADGMPGREPDEGEADAAEAFEGLRAEVAALRQGIELVYRQDQQAASAAPAPAPAAVDYSPTLGAMAKELKGVEARLKAIEGKPALGLTPSTFKEDIWQAGLKASEQSVTVMQAVKSSFENASKEFKDVLAGARARREQDVWVSTAALLGFMAGVLLWFLAAVLLPWSLGHRMAAALVSGDRWEAGSTLMNEANPEAWERVVRLNKACGDHAVGLCEAAIAVGLIPPAAPARSTPAPETAKPVPPVAAPAPVPPPSGGRAGAGR
jgi:hypothetical protein